MLGILVVFGVARAFLGPASSSLVVSLVPTRDFANAVTWNSSAWQGATIIGPAAGGLLLGLGERPFTNWLAESGQPSLAGVLDGHGPEIAYFTGFAFMLVGAFMVFAIPKPPKGPPKERPTLSNMLEGFRFIWKQKIILGAISLDLFAVLMGGAVALLPIFATDILVAGPTGLGLLRAAPGVGAIAVALFLARFPIRRNAGVILFWFVAAFGFFTLCFGLSRSIWLSVPLLALIGACDMISVSIRETIMQLWTPDEVRGRVNAVNSVFIGASNELGEFRAGVMAAFIGAHAAATIGAAATAFGAQAAVSFGGGATMAVAGIWSRIFPGLRKQDSLDRKMVDD
jgi:MFS family permease